MRILVLFIAPSLIDLASALALSNRGRRHMTRLKKNVYKLNKRVHAWNVDGSSGANHSSYTSWINFWEERTGLLRGRCSYSDCNNIARVGGHVWLKNSGVWIAPLCNDCNHYANAKRMQRQDNNHSSLKRGTVVVRAEYTNDMKYASRRFSSRLCITCNVDIAEQPPVPLLF